ncbi:death-associated inhibitor of apoptosis 1-like [Haliotis rufescens]|uniref:death-associated inhibitor of apoptosis 1-like n=1 Tax=Haliotis rufescens TaxID=6454 RepID=UPI00201F489C|nr:death-associated inhibitor of apoptosis 1-like [Haliotis rufescens]
MDVCGRFDVDSVTDCAEIIERSTDVYGEKLTDRLKSFAIWPLQMKQSPKSMAEAGFIYTGQYDRVYCFKCKIRVHRWMPEDDPMTEHFRLSPRCTYIHMLCEEPRVNKEGAYRAYLSSSAQSEDNVHHEQTFGSSDEGDVSKIDDQQRRTESTDDSESDSGGFSDSDF